jgi:flavodoxin
MADSRIRAMKALIVYYSKGGHVEKIARQIAEKLGADLDRIIPEKGYEGKEGYNRAGKESMFHTKPAIRFSKDPSSYDLVIVGSPTWVFNMSSPVRSYMALNKKKMKQAAFFTSGGSPWKFALWFLERAYGRKGVAAMHLAEKEIDSGSYEQKMDAFLAKLKG